MVLIKEHWKVYDVLIEGISMLGSYRSQFASILRANKPAKLIALLMERGS